MQSIPQFSPYPPPAPLRPPPPRRSSIRPASRGQAATTRLTPSSPFAHSFNTEGATDTMTNHDLFASQDCEEDTEDEVVEEEDFMVETPPEGSSASSMSPNCRHVMLSPPLSPPSPARPSTDPYNDPSDTSSNPAETNGRSATFDASLSKSIDEYISKLTQDDIRDKPRFDEVLQDIRRSSGVWMDPRRLKRVVLLNTRQRLLDGWKDDPAVSSENELLVLYQRRLMVHDIDNQLRLLDVPS
ncbi:MAG: hypothetical protein HETSPECPRED_002197 [Heterodermia speciosa]|uniref:Uncharacterized protein n=1 Tax=Heterodermia speciosa TaxID=116794 RepID=A0A8H3J3R7_9LECA|nr:MAG: hypothetical protein HETSPECPRED_002197 [Heterodermia speciosa]